MFEQYKITNCQALDNYQIKITFADGVAAIADLKHLAGKGVFEIWNDYEEFKKVFIHPISKTICWPDELDLDPINLKKNLIEISLSQPSKN